MNILSIRDHFNSKNKRFNCGGHDASIALISNGILKYFLKEERYSKIKKDANLKNSFDMFIKTVDEQIDYLHIISSYPTPIRNIFVDQIRKKYNGVKLINSKGNFHHLYHASIAFYNSGFDKSLVIVIDSSDTNSETAYIAEYPVKFKHIYSYSIKTPVIEKSQSLCNIYDTTTMLIGLPSTENGKTMGLSSYGERIELFPSLFKNYFFPTTATNFPWEYTINSRYHEEITTQLGKDEPDKIEITNKNYKFYADYCKEIQIQTQNAVAKLVYKLIKQTGITNVCISGGYGMNVVSNFNLLKTFPNINFYFEPLCDDGGISIGAGMYYYRKITNDKTIYPLETTSIHGFKSDISEYGGLTSNISDIAKLLYNNKSVAVYSGLAESGQRALGNRSILFNALNPNAKDIVNKIKENGIDHLLQLYWKKIVNFILIW